MLDTKFRLDFNQTLFNFDLSFTFEFDHENQIIKFWHVDTIPLNLYDKCSWIKDKKSTFFFVQSIACECLDPNVGTTTTTEAPCVDILPTKKCEKRKKKGKCSKNWMKKKCAKTCEQC